MTTRSRNSDPASCDQRHRLAVLRLFHAVCESARELSRRFPDQPGDQLCRDVFALGFVLVLFQKVPHLAGWRFEEVLFLYGFSLIPYGIFNMLSLNIYDFGNEYIMEGKFDRVLMRPVSSLFQVLFETFRIESFQEIATGIFCMWWATSAIWTWRGRRQNSLCWSSSEFAPAIIYVSVFLMLSTVSFWFEDRIGVHPPVWNVSPSGAIRFRFTAGPSVFPVLDHSFRPGLVLSQRAHAGPHGLPGICTARACSCSGFLPSPFHCGIWARAIILPPAPRLPVALRNARGSV